MNFEQINGLTLEKTYSILLGRILDLSVVPNGEQFVSLHSNEELDFYDRILLHPNLVKPSLEVLNSELVSYKQELTDAEQARLDEVARVDNIVSRFEAIDNLQGAMEESGLFFRNPALELKRIISEDDQERLELLESSLASFKDKESAKKIKSDRKEKGKLARQACEEVLEVVAGFNIERSLTKEQKDQMESENADLLQALMSKRPGKFKSLMVAKVPDGVLLTQEMKDEVLEVLAKYGL